MKKVVTTLGFIGVFAVMGIICTMLAFLVYNDVRDRHQLSLVRSGYGIYTEHYPHLTRTVYGPQAASRLYGNKSIGGLPIWELVWQAEPGTFRVSGGKSYTDWKLYGHKWYMTTVEFVAEKDIYFEDVLDGEDAWIVTLNERRDPEYGKRMYTYMPLGEKVLHKGETLVVSWGTGYTSDDFADRENPVPRYTL
jgi:hypothetical protein